MHPSVHSSVIPSTNHSIRPSIHPAIHPSFIHPNCLRVNPSSIAHIHASLPGCQWPKLRKHYFDL